MPSASAKNSDIAFLLKTAESRPPEKRKLKIKESIDLDLGDSDDDEDDEDFHASTSDQSEDSDDSDSSSGESFTADSSHVSELQEELQEGLPGTSQDDKHSTLSYSVQVSTTKDIVCICCICLNERFSDEDVMSCDNCGLTVHESCHGIASSSSTSSESSVSTSDPWFCDACLLGVKNPCCELCPNTGGAFKETDVGRWAHLLCALYCGATFMDVDKLSPVVLFDTSYDRYGAKPCSLCSDKVNSRTGICIKCDAGMCKQFFHATCAQRAGFLCVPTTSGDVQSADPYFANCVAHSDKALMKKRKQMFKLMKSNELSSLRKQLTPREQDKFQRRGKRQLELSKTRVPHWLPTSQKWQRLLHTNASVLMKLQHKAPTDLEAARELNRTPASNSIIQAFSEDTDNVFGKGVVSVPLSLTADFISYYEYRERECNNLIDHLANLKSKKEKLKHGETAVSEKYHSAELESRRVHTVGKAEVQTLSSLCKHISALSPKDSDVLNTIKLSEDCVKEHFSRSTKLCRTFSEKFSPRRYSGYTAQNSTTDIKRIELKKCGVCHKVSDQHLMTNCVTCKKYYHLCCLDPPLTKMPQTHANWGWECSFCGPSDDESSEEEPEVDVNAPRQLRGERKSVNRFSLTPLFAHEVHKTRPDRTSVINGCVTPNKGHSLKRKSAGSNTKGQTKRRSNFSSDGLSDFDNFQSPSETKRQYSKMDLQLAVNEIVADGTFSTKVAQKYHIPRSTLRNAVIRRVKRELQSQDPQVVAFKNVRIDHGIDMNIPPTSIDLAHDGDIIDLEDELSSDF